MKKKFRVEAQYHCKTTTMESGRIVYAVEAETEEEAKKLVQEDCENEAISEIDRRIRDDEVLNSDGVNIDEVLYCEEVE